MKSLKDALALLGLSAALVLSGPALADDDDDDDGGRTFEVTVTNLTGGQSFTPILVATHDPSVRLFEVGQEASAELATLAEGGNVAPLSQALLATGRVSDTADSGGLLDPGQSVTIRVTASGGATQVSLVAMLIPTNDTIMAFRNLPLPRGRSATVNRGPAYDAGSEPDDELCDNIPGPFCGGAGESPPNPDPDPLDEGFVHIQAGIQGIGDLSPTTFDWRNPVAEVTIRRSR